MSHCPLKLCVQVELLNGGVYRESAKLINKLSNSLAAKRHFRQTGKRLEQPVPKVEKVGNWLQGRLRKIYTTDSEASVRQACKSVEDSRYWSRLCWDEVYTVY